MSGEERLKKRIEELENMVRWRDHIISKLRTNFESMITGTFYLLAGDSRVTYVDHHDRMILVTQKFAEFFGYQSPDSMTNRFYYSFLADMKEKEGWVTQFNDPIIREINGVYIVKKSSPYPVRVDFRKYTFSSDINLYPRFLRRAKGVGEVEMKSGLGVSFPEKIHFGSLAVLICDDEDRQIAERIAKAHRVISEKAGLIISS